MKKVMLVDDSSTILMSMSEVLKKNGFDVQTANSGDEAVKLLQRGKPDLLITDLHMPGMDGIELIQHARGKGGLRFAPVLVLTTESQQAKRNAAKQAGATGWLVKPVSAEQLLQTVKQVLPGA